MTTQAQSSKAISAKLKEVISTQTTNNDGIQQLLLDMTMHAISFSDVDGFRKLVQGVKGMDRKAIVKWAKEYAPVNFDREGKATLNKAKFKTLDYTDKTVKELPHWTDEAQTVSQATVKLDVFKRLKSLYKQATEPKENTEVLCTEAIEYIGSAIEKFERENGPLVGAEVSK